MNIYTVIILLCGLSGAPSLAMSRAKSSSSVKEPVKLDSKKRKQEDNNDEKKTKKHKQSSSFTRDPKIIFATTLTEKGSSVPLERSSSVPARSLATIRKQSKRPLKKELEKLNTKKDNAEKNIFDIASKNTRRSPKRAPACAASPVPDGEKNRGDSVQQFPRLQRNINPQQNVEIDPEGIVPQIGRHINPLHEAIRRGDRDEVDRLLNEDSSEL